MIGQSDLNGTFPQFCKDDEAEDGAAGPLLCVEVTKIRLLFVISSFIIIFAHFALWFDSFSLQSVFLEDVNCKLSFQTVFCKKMQIVALNNPLFCKLSLLATFLQEGVIGNY